MSEEKTHFGYETIDKDQKEERVAEVFHSVASKYNVMNDVMSFGIHRLWKNTTMQLAAAKRGDQVLDLAGGTGDLTILLSRRVGPKGRVVLSDINSSMLEEGRKRLINKGIVENVEFKQINAEHIPFEDNTFDIVTIGFGLRNVTDKLAALKEMKRVLKPGGRAVILEFSKPTVPGLGSLYDFYSFNIIPKMGKLIADDEASYRYLTESIRMHPGQEELKAMMLEAGFDEVDYKNLTGGIVAVHRGFVY
ncbi:bifunctional demethylmenaquinone methyltransferase/2-methoxy-6-polyprenyl-1,4-benzoquinol methylase UbiE [Ignatzschineria sp. RMDPL8A]|uniref:bifunctional demethylmenaquinone methyltransferase/2-methoxy-6-polyprenyl-1,4-benzoquinol methylase UbiE n=1 Tax=Ignatzschineria sp. RMDPL8A TaxID=2999236 RepID=UPI001697C8F8|nr:bifunctional demethylmenaquinone methyltransferase/2-methoxy-6-polyprenyl-1,4-benzoquinol methylase UbiE [Ignatzschineria sp. RMDPL8A]MDG9729961.1 bifunctional demethylmenaquinone methyltransferase/2-methoxy-6-polyprenyl-1,4-benzoquinol methylase UbiE [Ignatzschineria sp. RMDPL8A]NLD09274.1 bifunctional demethylmenaquinone methyltransferase/2-methoxy-6-polyprenyl-1,4-benzoquinol methylase UbiE [Xanthomonadaceae bacterium]